MSAQEPRLTAFYSDDENMLQAYKDGKDLYSVIASLCFDKPYEECLEFYPEGTKIIFEGKEVICGKKTHQNKSGKERRSQAKAVLLGLLYGRGAKSIAEQVNKTVEEGQEIINKFFKSFPKVKKWINATQEKARKLGYVEDWYGRRRHLPDVNLPPFEANYKIKKDQELQNFNPFLGCSDRVYQDDKLLSYLTKCKKVRSNKDFDVIKLQAEKDGIELKANTNLIAQAERQSVNSIVQGGAATLTKLAMKNIHYDKELNDLGFHLLITVHDEVLGECPEENADKVADRLTRVMIDTAKPYMSVPMSCDAYNVSSWYEDEYGVSVQEEYKKLIKKDLTEQQAFDRICVNHTEMSQDKLHTIIYG